MMSIIMEDDTQLCRNSIRYLHQITLLSELNIPALKSIYSTKRRLMELRKSILLPSNFTRTSITCQRCLINLKEGPASFRLVSAKKQTEFAKKVLAKQKNGKPLSKYQQKYLEKMTQFRGNQLAITCKFCKNEALIKMEKPKKDLKQKVISLRKLKKKKKKDKFCGLKEDVVLSLAYQNNTKKLDEGSIGNKLIKKKKKSKLVEYNLEVKSSLTPQNMRSLDDFTEVKRERPTIKFKIPKEFDSLDTPKENLRQSKHKLKKKNQNLNKLSEILSKSNTVKNPISSLKQFLQGL